jgi:hypothetical protein
MDRCDQRPAKRLHHQESVSQGLHVMDNVEGVPGNDSLQELQGPQAEYEHLRKESKAGSDEFKKIQGKKDSPGGGRRNKISAHPPKVKVFYKNRLRPRHGPWFWGAHQNRQGMPHSGQLSGEKVEIDPLAAAIWVSSVAKEADLHFSIAQVTVCLFYLPPAFDLSSFSAGGWRVDSEAGGDVLMVSMVQPIQNPRAMIPRKPMITGMARAQ